jgi:polynucleotide 5'-hydroxyl-kinase GRC3/NOL9
MCQIAESDADELDRPLSPEISSEDWLRTIEDCASGPSVISIVGPSTSGKSTFAKRLLNRYLTGQGKSALPVRAVCYLDLDFEKPEYAPHGQICLVKIGTLNLGPSFTHPATVPLLQKSEYNGIICAYPVPTHFANYKKYYRTCAEDLFLTYKNLRSQDPSLSLIINTPGSLYTQHFEILSDLLARFKPHHTVHLGDLQAIDTEIATRLHSLQILSSQHRSTLHEITAQVPISAPMRSESELRAMHMQSYFHLRGRSNNQPDTLAWNASPMSHLVPWEFCYQETREQTQDFVGFAMYSEPLEESSLMHALNGSVVQIIESTSSAIPTPFSDLSRTTKYQIPYFPKSHRTGMVEPLDPKTSKLVCTALVRGLDLKRRVVQVLVPKTHEVLLYNLVAERTVFVGGCCKQPEWAYLEDAYATHDTAKITQLPAEVDMTNIPWVREKSLIEDMGYLNTVRRVRKFQT